MPQNSVRGMVLLHGIMKFSKSFYLIRRVPRHSLAISGCLRLGCIYSLNFLFRFFLLTIGNDHALHTRGQLLHLCLYVGSQIGKESLDLLNLFRMSIEVDTRGSRNRTNNGDNRHTTAIRGTARRGIARRRLCCRRCGLYCTNRVAVAEFKLTSIPIN